MKTNLLDNYVQNTWMRYRYWTFFKRLQRLKWKLVEVHWLYYLYFLLKFYQGQWWSMRRTQWPQRLQWCDLFGLIMLHLLHSSQSSLSEMTRQTKPLNHPLFSAETRTKQTVILTLSKKIIIKHTKRYSLPSSGNQREFSFSQLY